MEGLLKQLLDFISLEFRVMLTAAIPIVEVKGAIPVGLSLGLSPLHATVLSLIGSIIPMPFILFSVRPIFNYLRKTRMFRSFVDRLIKRTIKNSSGKIQKYGVWGLFIFVAIPLPGTGVWSGSLAAALLDIRFKWAFPAIFFGNVIAAFIIVALSNGVMWLFS